MENLMFQKVSPSSRNLNEYTTQIVVIKVYNGSLEKPELCWRATPTIKLSLQ